jgi:membrane associated rhomboid family serine protease
MDFDIPALIWDQVMRMNGWRFYVCIAAVAVIVAAIWYFFGWTNTTISIAIVATLAGALSGVLWQYLHERER